MQLYFANPRAMWRVGDVAGVDLALLEESLERHRLPAGTPVLLDDVMRRRDADRRARVIVAPPRPSSRACNRRWSGWPGPGYLGS